MENSFLIMLKGFYNINLLEYCSFLNASFSVKSFLTIPLKYRSESLLVFLTVDSTRMEWFLAHRLSLRYGVSTEEITCEDFIFSPCYLE